PPPPDFATKQKDLLGDSTVFWIAQNGIKMTGMPAFGASHSEEEIRAIVHFVKRLPSLRAVEYDDMVKSVTADKDREHRH
ncbi:MAG TPA: cytochrome c, partial [Syntrophorhabdaceae bacterium]|nr:cytochrome c [Syntrophorhabdaceae bacterium]